MSPTNGFPTFRSHPLVRGGHAQTILGAYLPHRVQISGTVDHRIELPDGDTLVLHDDVPAGWSPSSRVVLMIHGLGGCHQSPYCERLTAKLLARGIRAFRLDMRGCGHGTTLARYPGHAGRSEDATAAIEKIADICPGSPVSLIGYSLGGNIVLKLAGECGDHPPSNVDRVVAVCPPIDLAKCCENIGRGMNWIYDRSFIRSLTKLTAARAKESPELYANTPLHPPPRKLLEFDDRITAPLSGFSGAAEYYARCSSGPLFANIQIPTQIIAASDDPLIPARLFDNVPHSSAVTVHIAEGGGHLGFIARRGIDADTRWIDWRLLEMTE